MNYFKIFLITLVWSSAGYGQSSTDMQMTSIKSLSSAYLAKRSAYMDKTTKTISAKNQLELDKMVASIKAANAQSYEYNYAMYLNSGRSLDAFTYLENAERYHPDNVDLYDDFVYHYEMDGNAAKRKQYCKQLYLSNTIHASVMEYNYNVLMSIELNGIIFTNGSIDTYPLFIWQDVKGIRKDVTIINLDMLSEKKYRERKSAEAHLKIKPQSTNVKTIEWIIKNNPNKKLYVGHTISQDILKTFKSDLYLSGLTYKHSKTPIDNVKSAVYSYENSFKKEQLKRTQTNLEAKRLNFNYTLPLITVLRYYHNHNEEAKATEIRKLILKIAKEANKENIIKQYLKSEKL